MYQYCTVAEGSACLSNLCKCPTKLGVGGPSWPPIFKNVILHSIMYTVALSMSGLLNYNYGRDKTKWFTIQ